MEKVIFTSESVTEGHPDKICDQISDAILDDLLRQDPDSRVAVESLTKTGLVIVAGEVTSHGYCDVQTVAREVLKDIGYTDSKFGISGEDAGVLVSINEQSPEIGIGVDVEGAGDQGMMFGYATNETPEYMPLPITLAHKLTSMLAEVRKNGIIPHLGPDGKSQVSIEYGNEIRIEAVVIAQQHTEDITEEELHKQIIEKVINPICGDLMDSETKVFINATGKFVIGGPKGDAGLTGRKIIVDTYGGMGRHGGGAFSGKDASKVDRSGAYAARYIAKNLVAAELASKCEVQISYAIGIAEPTSVLVDTFGTGKVSEAQLIKLVKKHFPLKPKEIIEKFGLKKPIFRKTASYGHFGREEFPWEQMDKVNLLKNEVSMR